MTANVLHVVVLGDHIYGAHRIWRAVRDVPGLRYTIFICNNRWRKLVFLAANVYGCLKIGLGETLDLFRAVAAGRLGLCVRFGPLKKSIPHLQRLQPDVGLHAMNVIYRREVIDCFKQGILNAHAAKLPEFRGRHVLEWSLLYDAETGVTPIFIDEGIDTGVIVTGFRPVRLKGFKKLQAAKRSLYRRSMVFLREALVRLARGDTEFQRNDVAQGRQFYTMSNLFRSAAEDLLGGGLSGS